MIVRDVVCALVCEIVCDLVCDLVCDIPCASVCYIACDTACCLVVDLACALVCALVCDSVCALVCALVCDLGCARDLWRCACVGQMKLLAVMHILRPCDAPRDITACLGAVHLATRAVRSEGSHCHSRIVSSIATCKLGPRW